MNTYSPDDIDKHFAPIAERYGLSPSTPTSWPRGVTLHYSSERVRLQITCESGSGPWGTVGPVSGPAFGIHELSETLSVTLQQLAMQTEAHASALLSGDFSTLPLLLSQRAVRRREDNQRKWGTATGESPRFTERPTLDALFDDATNDGIVDARCYQAVWDWGVTLRELSVFIGETDEAVARRLARWDGLECPGLTPE